ncbi:MAG TPA: hypothetical protein VIH90_01015 [Candidatus Saccharimonadales bacterium]
MESWKEIQLKKFVDYVIDILTSFDENTTKAEKDILREARALYDREILTD